jgi:peptidyl-prolyl cis-trans isomerase-like protein 2
LGYSYQDPFEDYKVRLAKKLAKRVEAEQSASTQNIPEKKKEDDINWFGVKVGTGSSVFGTEAAGESVGKYLNLKRPLEGRGGVAAEGEKKKRKTGFGDFDNW